jgi:hypothetical protein
MHGGVFHESALMTCVRLMYLNVDKMVDPF